MKTTRTTVLAILLTAMLLLVMPAVAEEEGQDFTVNLQEGDILLSGESYAIEFGDEALRNIPNKFIIVGIIPKGEALYAGNWQIANNDCELWAHNFFIGENISPGEYDIKIIVYSRSENCFSLRCYERITIENITVIAVSDMYV